MYPHQYFGLFPSFPREHKVFVAMSFDPRFRSRWKKVIEPGIGSVKIGGQPLEAHRVDASQISDSILTEILDGISRSRLVLADVTAHGSDSGGAVRNGNVMYEVGLAHAVRLPEEVLLFRSDSCPILFDIANVRVNSYDPDGDPGSARKQVAEAIVEATRRVDLKRHLAVRAAVQSLDALAWTVLSQACEKGRVRHFETRNVAQALSNTPRNAAIVRLLELGALETDCGTPIREVVRGEAAVDPKLGDDRFFAYRPTPFGKAVHQYFLNGVRGIMLIESVAKKIADEDVDGSNPSIEDGPKDQTSGNAS